MTLSAQEISLIYTRKLATPNRKYYGSDENIYIGTEEGKLKILTNIMELRLKRDLKNESYTLGKLFIDGTEFCYTVEDIIRDKNNDDDLNDPGEEKVHGKTAIPKGEYKVILSMSNRFKKIMPEVLNVPGFAGIRIHSGNTAEDTEGCIIVGTVRTPNGVGMSRDCFTRLMKRLEGQKEIKIIIE